MLLPIQLATLATAFPTPSRTTTTNSDHFRHASASHTTKKKNPISPLPPRWRRIPLLQNCKQTRFREQTTWVLYGTVIFYIFLSGISRRVANSSGVCLYEAAKIRRPLDIVRLKSVGTTVTLNAVAYTNRAASRHRATKIPWHYTALYRHLQKLTRVFGEQPTWN